MTTPSTGRSPVAPERSGFATRWPPSAIASSTTDAPSAYDDGECEALEPEVERRGLRRDVREDRAAAGDEGEAERAAEQEAAVHVRSARGG